MFGFFSSEACGILAPRPGIELAPPALEGEVLTTGPPGKSLTPFHLSRSYLGYLQGRESLVFTSKQTYVLHLKSDSRFIFFENQGNNNKHR